MTQAPLLEYCNPGEELTVQCDASDKGLGAALMQNGKPVAFASRAFTDPETCYAQIEKEMLAVVYALQKFDQYVCCLLYTSPSPRDLSTSRMPSSA